MKTVVNNNLYIVGIGASAGGLEALQILLKNLPAELNCAYVIAQHLSPTHKSMMVPLLARETSLKVRDVEDGIVVEQGVVYVTPPDKDIFVGKDGRLHLQVAKSGSLPKPCVDMFFESLAEAKKEYAIGVILSGTGSDGSRGIRAIKAEGGLTMAQEPSEAKYDGMPRSAINTGHIDIIISPQDFANEFEELIKLPRLSAIHYDDWHSVLKEQIFALLLKEKRVDFSSYKQSTIDRRIERRMSAIKIGSIKEYVEHLKSNRDEVLKLYKDLLIGVTSFFRDAEAFEALTGVLKAEFATKKAGDSIRVWVAGCSTGEEAYSIAMVLSEMFGNSIGSYKVQIFATDLDEDATAFARKGVYAESAIANIKKQLVKKYFTKNSDSYEVIKPVRDMIIFSTHDLIKDPPFLRVDLILCRNVLIYFNQSLQQKVMASFHHSLDVNGVLFLGKSESISTRDDWFVQLDKQSKIFKSLYSSRGEGYIYSSYTLEPLATKSANLPKIKSRDVKDRAKDIIGETVFPYYVVLNENFDILYFNGGENPYFTIGRQGDATLNFFKLLLPDLSLAARAVLHESKKIRNKVFSKILKINSEGDKKYLQFLSMPFSNDDSASYYLFAFLEYNNENFESFINSSATDDSTTMTRNKEMEIELENMRQYLQTVIEELETSNEELQSSNEELQSSNEELQSSNEELQTTNEELQSTNEELQVAYTELRLMYDEREIQKKLLEEKNVSIEEAEYQLRTVVENEPECVKIVDANGLLVYINPAGLDILEATMAQVKGKDILEVVDPKYRQAFTDMHKRAMAGEKSSMTFESIGLKGKRCWLETTSVPMKTRNGAVVLSVTRDITQQKQAGADTKKAEHKFHSIFEASFDGIVLLDLQTQHFVEFNSRVLEMYGYTAEEFRTLTPKDQDVIYSAEQIEIAEQNIMNRGWDRFETKHKTKDGTIIDVEISARRLDVEDRPTMLVTFRDITEEKLRQSTLESQKADLERNKIELDKRTKQLNDFIASNTAFAWEVDTSGRYTFVSSNVQNILGYEVDEILGKTPFDFMDEQEKARIADQFMNILSNRLQIENLQNSNVKKDGDKVCLLTNGVPFYDLDGLLLGYRGTDLDITSETRKNSMIEIQKKEFETIFNCSKDGIAILDLESNFLDCNDAYLEMTGLSKEELLKTSCAALSIPEDIERSKAAIQEVLKNGYLRDFEKTCLIKDSQKIIINMSLSLMPDKKRILISTKDVTKKRELENKLTQMNQHLQELVDQETQKRIDQERLLLQQSKMAMMGEMIGAIGHQWRQPLNTLGIKVQDIPMAVRFGEVDQDYADKFKNETMSIILKMSKTIDDFRDFFRPVKDKANFYLEDAISETLGIIYVQLKNHGIEVFTNNLDMSNKDHSVYGYQNELEQTILIILSNAQDALNDKKIANPKVVISLSHTDSNKTLLTISDNAGGIPEHILDRIFEPYFTTKEPGKGTGIGLYIAKEIVERQMGGKISVKNVDGGARFEIEV